MSAPAEQVPSPSPHLATIGSAFWTSFRAPVAIQLSRVQPDRIRAWCHWPGQQQSQQRSHRLRAFALFIAVWLPFDPRYVGKPQSSRSAPPGKSEHRLPAALVDRARYRKRGVRLRGSYGSRDGSSSAGIPQTDRRRVLVIERDHEAERNLVVGLMVKTRLPRYRFR